MAVQEQTPYIEYVGNGTTKVFPLTFDCEDQDHLIITIDGDEPSFGSWLLIDECVSFKIAPTISRKVVFQRNSPFERTTNYNTYNNSFRPEPVNKDLDRIWLKLQEMGLANWLLGLRIDKETADRMAADIYYYTQALEYADSKDAEIRQHIESLVNNITGKDFLPIQDKYINTWNNLNQEHENKRMSKSRLGQKLLYETPVLNIDTGTHKYPQGGCKVGDSLFIKIGTGDGVVGSSSEEFIFAEYNFKTGALISQTQPLQTLGHHELSGFIKNGKTYLVTSYQPKSDTFNRSGIGISLIEWKGSLTNLNNVKQFELLDESQAIGFPAIDEKGENVYIINKQRGNNRGGLSRIAPILNIASFKLADILNNKLTSQYSFNIEIPTGDGLLGSNAFNGFAATSDHLYVVFGGAYGRAEIHKYTVNGDFVEKTLTAHSRAARPQSEIITEDLFLYNAEPEGIFIDQGRLYLIVAEAWYGAREFVKFNNKFYLARYGMVGKSPTTHADHWVKVPFIPTVWTEYSETMNYKGRDTTRGKFVRTVIEISLKNDTNFDLLMPDSVANVPNLINNSPDQVHIYGSLLNGNNLTFGHYDSSRQTWQRNVTMTGNGLKLYDTRYVKLLNDESSSISSYHSNASSLMRLIPNDKLQSDGVVIYGKYHGDATEKTPHPYLARLESDGKETTVMYRDGRFYNYSHNGQVAAKFFNKEKEAIGIYTTDTAVQIDTAHNYTWFGKSVGGIHDTATIGMNHNTKVIYPPADGASNLGSRDLKWGQVNTKDLILEPSSTVNPIKNGELVVEATSNSNITIKLKGSDGVTRSTVLNLS